MEIKEIPVEEAVGRVVAHDMTQIIPQEFKGARFQKGDVIDSKDISTLKDMGKEHIYVLSLDEGTIHEDDAACQIAKKVVGKNIVLSEANEGKINLKAEQKGILKVDKDLLLDVNSIDEILITSSHDNIFLQAGDSLAGVRINPLTIEERKLKQFEAILGDQNLFGIEPFVDKKVGVVVTGNEVYSGRIEDEFVPTLQRKFKRWGGELLDSIIVPDEVDEITEALSNLKESGAEVLITGGGMSVDPDDLTPKGIRNTGAEIVKYGVPVLPGNKLMLAYWDGIPVLGLPACVIFEEITVFDLIYPRLLTGEEFTRNDLIELSYGGYCYHCDVCQFPQCSFGKI
ncbi:molybdopterin-binding protein [Acetohalobium arabaticum]|uniref:Molybdopterin molybdenumtransferase n=1 Tax=Acetohalobium arabaticum (strain ATCC 49924 / DSM 5501 / Z-7288) TaxID=574087 RepID=D9QUV3_ACEAZ|nr:molybdopterin-binding protein [Acetohalobium arabaticum]ADL12012.1 molybdopterin binding domain protein [Acetohalobium arabaticum DSM 5501]